LVFTQKLGKVPDIVVSRILKALCQSLIAQGIALVPQLEHCDGPHPRSFKLKIQTFGQIVQITDL